MFAGSSDESDSSMESETCFKGIVALKRQASMTDGLLFDTLILKEDGTLKYSLEEKKHNKYELHVTLKGPSGTPFEVIFIFDMNFSWETDSIFFLGKILNECKFWHFACFYNFSYEIKNFVTKQDTASDQK